MTHRGTRVGNKVTTIRPLSHLQKLIFSQQRLRYFDKFADNVGILADGNCCRYKVDLKELSRLHVFFRAENSTCLYFSFSLPNSKRIEHKSRIYYKIHNTARGCKKKPFRLIEYFMVSEGHLWNFFRLLWFLGLFFFGLTYISWRSMINNLITVKSRPFSRTNIFRNLHVSAFWKAATALITLVLNSRLN